MESVSRYSAAGLGVRLRVGGSEGVGQDLALSTLGPWTAGALPHGESLV